MENITHLFDEIYTPRKALVIYQSSWQDERLFVEAFDIGISGQPINAHPLSEQEHENLAALLDTSAGLKRDFLTSEGLMPEKVLSLNPGRNGYAIWYTPAQEVPLYFHESLGIPSGKAMVPAMIWKATKGKLWVYALAARKKPTEETALYYAPFFNVYKDGNVCMGNVSIDIDELYSLERFIEAWEQYFWNSYFSHLNDTFCPVTVNIVQLWQQQVSSGQPFNTAVLIKTGRALRDIL